MGLPARADFAKRSDAFSETNVGVNVGGGVKMSLAGPLRLRLDYRVFTLKGTPLLSRTRSDSTRGSTSNSEHQQHSYRSRHVERGGWKLEAGSWQRDA